MGLVRSRPGRRRVLGAQAGTLDPPV